MLLGRLGDCPVTGGVTLVPGQGHQPVTAERPNYEETPWDAHDAARPTLSEEQKSEQVQNGYRDRCGEAAEPLRVPADHSGSCKVGLGAGHLMPK